MIPIAKAAEPPGFDANVRQPGLVFLARVPNPNNNQWNSHSYWSEALWDLHVSYNDVCAYCGSFTLRAAGAGPGPTLQFRRPLHTQTS